MTRNEALADTAAWWKQLSETSNKTFLPLFFDTHRYLVLKGGGGSGKSIFAGRKVLERVTTEPGHRFLVCRKVAKTLRESCFEQLIGQNADYYPESGMKVNKSDMVMTFRNGSKIIFAGLDDVEKLKSIYDITGIWIEEASELDESDFNQLDIRLRTDSPWYLQIILTFNPISMMHWLKKRFFDHRDKRARVHESTYKDNRFLIPEAVETLEAFKETDEYYYQVYCLGMWGVTGKSVFNGKQVTERLLHAPEPKAVGRFDYDYDGLKITNIRWVDDPDGAIRIYEQPEELAPYVLGGDTAGEGSDKFVGQVIDNRTGKQAATLRHTYDEDVYTRQMYCLGTYYNEALIGIEVNYSTYPVMELERLGYKNQYVRETMDDYTHRLRKAYGWRTDTKTRPVLIAELIKAVRDDISSVSDKATLEEMLTFVRSESWKPEAEAGAHDDCIMALGIAHQIRPQQRYTSSEKILKAKWTASMREDYRNASPAEREYLLRKWGSPTGG